MMCLRAFLCRHARTVLALLALVLAMKALLPAGTMLAPAGERLLTVTICADASGAPRQITIAVPVRKDTGAKEHGAAADKHQPCAFAALGKAALGGADPLLLAAALSFVLLLGLSPTRAPLRRVPAFLRPPLRGPPLPTA
ncbi:DUF2946 family protein [Erythrobacter cryptus]|uniref:DUF2946 family protein n=1 Tax=Erythrobacter cryptus TaxID=196588 RepID=UPI0004201E41|nr:DUF2946 family protein [Erythrobacter cryptus]GIX18537.1 MAG: hypothetical protein KatS3mg120_0213 [Erythrobacter sp.]